MNEEMRTRYKLIQRCAKLVPQPIRAAIRSRISMKDYDFARRLKENPFRNMSEADYESSEFCLGIIEEVTQYHKHYISACRDMRVSYRVLSILEDDWVENFRKSGCDAFLVWPSCMPTSAKEAFDYRLYMLEKELGTVVYPTWKECWLSEHKPRLRDWMESNGIPHPKTVVYYDRSQALEFACSAELPLVVKTATGASASGITVVRTRKELEKAIRLAFGRGLRPRSYDPNDRQWGYVYIQKYHPNVKEWRMVRIGESYFGYRKEPAKNGIHSASKAWSWMDPGRGLLDLTRKVTDLGGFTSMDVDVFETEDGEFLVNECQTVFGCSTPAIQMKVDGKEGRYQCVDGNWVFQRGEFCGNHMCNLRVEALLDRMRHQTRTGRNSLSGVDRFDPVDGFQSHMP